MCKFDVGGYLNEKCSFNRFELDRLFCKSYDDCEGWCDEKVIFEVSCERVKFFVWFFIFWNFEDDGLFIWFVKEIFGDDVLFLCVDVNGCLFLGMVIYINM